MTGLVQDAIDASIPGRKKKKAMQRQARIDAAKEAEEPELLMPDQDALRRAKRRELAKRTGGRTSTVLTGRTGGPGGTTTGASSPRGRPAPRPRLPAGIRR